MRFGSLFSGIGGLDLGLERAGMECVWQSEIDPYASRVLAKHWPHTPNLGDITLIDWSTVEPVDLICGGYPCQPFSLAGARRGDTDARHLWPYFADAIRLLRPRWALLENVPGHLSLGFGSVLGDLAELGYDTDWDCIPAAAVGAPHLRYRIFVVAHTRKVGRQLQPFTRGGATQNRRWTPNRSGDSGSTPTDTNSHQLRQQPVNISRGDGASVVRVDGENRDVADPERVRLQGRNNIRSGEGLGSAGDQPAPSGATIGRAHWAIEPDVGRVAHGVPNRVDRLKCLGNAVVPQVAEWVGQQIMNAATS